MKRTDKPSKVFFTYIVTAALFAVVILSGCNTMRGLGEDTEDAGEAIQDAAN